MVAINRPETLAQTEIIHLTGMFERTGNVAAAWRCFHIARKWGFPVPPVIAAEVDRFAAEIASVTDAALGGDADARLDSKTVGRLWGGLGPGKKEPAGGLAEWQRNISATVSVLMKRSGGAKEAEAVEATSRALGMSPSNVRAAVKQIKEMDGGSHDSEM